MTDLWKLTVSEAAFYLREGSLLAEQYATSLIARLKCNTHLNAFSAFDPEYVLEAARALDIRRQTNQQLGILHGVPISLKDNINTSRLPTSAGTPGLQGNYQAENAAVVEALCRAGAVVFGKNTMHELAFGATSNNTFGGPARNPHDHNHIAGGSSGGTAAAVAAQLVPAGIGTDTGGSIRVPAALCGVLGFRPTVGRWPQSGIVPVSSTRDTAGPIARSVEDLQLLDSVVTGARRREPPTSLAGIRLGIPKTHFWDRLDQETEKLAMLALAALKEAGAALVDCNLSSIIAPIEAISLPIVLYEATRDVSRYLSDFAVPITAVELFGRIASPDVQRLAAALVGGSGRISDSAYSEAISVTRANAISRFGETLRSHQVDAIIFPTTPCPAARIGEDISVELAGIMVPTFSTFIRNTDPGSLLGLPGVSLPIGFSSAGLPIGIALDSFPGEDAKLLAIAAAIEPALADFLSRHPKCASEVHF